MLATLFSLLSALTIVIAQDQVPIVYDAIHNASTIVGTWSSGSQAVQTGSGFVNPSQKSFTYPKTPGVSYSFDDDGNYEIARYRFVSNATDPRCITGVVNWAHGKYILQDNGSITMTPFGDGFQQVEMACSADTRFIEEFNHTELYTAWRIFSDPDEGFKLHLFGFDGAPVAPQFQVSKTPIMLPAKMLRNVTAPTTVLNRRSGGAAPAAVLSRNAAIGFISLILLVAVLGF